MSDREANDVSGYGICFECKEAAPNSELRAVCIHNTRHKGTYLPAFLCRDCGSRVVSGCITIEDTPDPDHVPATCGIPKAAGMIKALRETPSRYRLDPFGPEVVARSMYEAKVMAASEFLRGKEVKRGT
jgi:hypothetical protein